ncbi:MAG: NAD(P)-dependent oxidoreductase [candidate division Zixibacteria bacterium]|nr:NAD(P)-dependent oxidoreductase [candidate division Zixibacteria bacterium]
MIGSEGNIGAPLVSYLRSVGYSVLECDIRPGWREDYLSADISQPLDLLPAFDRRPHVVFLLAAHVGRMLCEQAASLAVSTNVAGINNVLQLCKRVDARCVFFSSSEVYGPNCDPMDEVHSVPQPANRYALTKWLGEQLVEYEVRTSGLRAVTLRPCMVYDEYETVGEHRSAMIRFASNLARGRPIEVHRGSARSWLHVSDMVRAVEAAGRLQEYAVINVGHPEVISMAELAEMIRVELNASPELVLTSDLPPGVTRVKRPTLHRQRALLGLEPKVGIIEGVRRLCEVQARSGLTDIRPIGYAIGR